jgi:hypothetical protein
VKLNAVTAGQNLQELMKLVGTVLLIRSQACQRLSPQSSDCMPKKYELNIGVKVSWLTMTLVVNDKNLDEKLK